MLRYTTDRARPGLVALSSGQETERVNILTTPEPALYKSTFTYLLTYLHSMSGICDELSYDQ